MNVLGRDMRADVIWSKTSNIANRALFPYRWYMLRNGCIFIHIPKTAGTSLLHALNGRGGPRDHLPWTAYYIRSPKRFNTYFKFSFVRNPLDRALSAYNYLMAGGNGISDIEVSKQVANYESFNDFVIFGLGSGRFRNHLQFQPQSNFIVGPTGRIVVDYLGYYESLDVDFENIKTSLKRVQHLSWESRSQSARGTGAKDIKDELSVRAFAVLEELYRQDLEVFGYSIR